MYFGLTNSPATFQMMMNEILQDMIMEGVVSVYLDDILIFTNSLEEHCQVSCLVLDRCRGTPAAYPPVTGQGRLNGCGSAKAG
jgi:hypothetical protein